MTKKKSVVYQPAYPSFKMPQPPETPSIPADVRQEVGNFKPIDVNELDKKINNQLLDFSALLDTLSSVEDKQRALWKQIYENAVQDRKNAYLMWADLYVFVCANPTEHAIHGQNLSRYMERMSKANDQILKLAEMVSNAASNNIDEVFSEEVLYENIQKTAGKH
jgi:calcineurin-like phosphoesterase family protein